MTGADLERDRHELRTYGRRRGHGLSARQQQLLAAELPRVSLPLSRPCPADPAALFGAPMREVWLEIGFGGGEHLLWQAKAHPDVGIIGCEPFIDGVVKVLDAVARGGMPNIRLHADDARQVLRWLPPAWIARAFLLFPDPWPKKRHRKRRLMAEPTLAMLARVMRPGGELRFATDIGSYVESALLAIHREGSFTWSARVPGDWRDRPADWPETRYESKALAAGRRCYYLSFRRQDTAAVP